MNKKETISAKNKTSVALEHSPNDFENALAALEHSPNDFENASVALERFPNDFENAPVALEHSPNDFENASVALERSPNEFENAPATLERSKYDFGKRFFDPANAETVLFAFIKEEPEKMKGDKRIRKKFTSAKTYDGGYKKKGVIVLVMVKFLGSFISFDGMKVGKEINYQTFWEFIFVGANNYSPLFLTTSILSPP